MAETFTPFAFVKQYGGRCRDCADHDGICPSNGLPCEPAQRDQAIRHVLDAVEYGERHGFIQKDQPHDA